MRTRLLGFATAAIVAALGIVGPVAQTTAAPRVDGDTCVQSGGAVQYDSVAGQWKCIGGSHADEPIN
ncbi:hypothetical protein [Streptomyces sp. NPDC001594]|uniref:hypothetical protein n=1 Tax=Streptomyces sp. NPDC001594 TaxID=3364590 RepID=UPI00369ABAA9